ncbi:hypothetical protein HanIR_Chr15g0745191 [Helianthus annuus]|nr:hypothetical protein HanIR_Chr15g0745191 [Helianthus annuus]
MNTKCGFIHYIIESTLDIPASTDVARDTETKIKHVDSKNTRVFFPNPQDSTQKARNLK